MQDVDLVRSAFTDPAEFWSSPLYRRLSTVVADNAFLVTLAAHARPGQGPTFAFFGAVHAILLDGSDHALADYYPSVRGAAARPPDDGAGASLISFAHTYADEIRHLLCSRLVQTNHVQRALGLRLGLHLVARRAGRQSVHVLEVGTSAGLVLRQGAYGYRLGDHAFGDPTSPVQLAAEWRSDVPVPDLDDVPSIASLTGIDLNPLDPGHEPDRRWLAALVWPENRAQAQLMHTALALAERTPVPVLRGDAVVCCPMWGRAVPAGATRIVFHCATRMHVPLEQRTDFDQAIDALDRDGPLYRIAIEGEGLTITGPDGDTDTAFEVDGHLAWARPLRAGGVEAAPRPVPSLEADQTRPGILA